MARTRIRRGAALAVLWRTISSNRRPGAPGLVASLAAVPRLTGSVLGGRYDGMSRGRLAALAAAALYIVSPIDLVPELLPVIGVVDDLGVLAWLTGSVLLEADRFMEWEQDEAVARVHPEQDQSAEHPIVPGEVIR